MSEHVKTSGMSNEELIERINNCRVRILEELGIEVPESLKAGAGHVSD